MPQALAQVCGRPLHIYAGDVRRRGITVTIAGEQGRAGTVPIRLIRSGDEYNCAHYDLVSGAALQWAARRPLLR
jgi:hypothetical protein